MRGPHAFTTTGTSWYWRTPGSSHSGKVLGRRARSVAEGREDDAVTLADAEHLEPRVGRRCQAWRCRLADALTTVVVHPSVIRAHQRVVAHLAERQRGASMGTLVAGRVQRAVRTAPQHDRYVEQGDAERRVDRDVATVGDRHPAVQQYRIPHAAIIASAPDRSRSGPRAASVLTRGSWPCRSPGSGCGLRAPGGGRTGPRPRPARRRRSTPRRPTRPRRRRPGDDP